MSGWWFSSSASAATRSTNAIASGKTAARRYARARRPFQSNRPSDLMTTMYRFSLRSGNDADHAVSDHRRRHDRCRSSRGHPRARRGRRDRHRRRGAAPAVQAAAALEEALERRRRGEALVRPGARRRRPEDSAGGSSSSTSTRAARRTTAATSTRTRRCCSRPAARRAVSAATTARSSTSARSTTTASCARRRKAARSRRDRRRVHRLRARGVADGHRRKGDAALPGARDRLARPPGRSRSFVTDYYREKGVEMLADETVASVDGLSVTLGSGRTLEAMRSSPASASCRRPSSPKPPGSPVDNGIVVDELGRVGRPRRRVRRRRRRELPELPLGKRVRVEHEDHANTHGRAVGANMAGANAPYDYLPFFYSDMFDLGYEAVGELDSRLDDARGTGRSRTARASSPTSTTSAARAASCSGTSWGKVDAARELIRAAQPVDEAVLLGVSASRGRGSRGSGRRRSCEYLFRPLAHARRARARPAARAAAGRRARVDGRGPRGRGRARARATSSSRRCSCS